MQEWVLEGLVCPDCLPDEHALEPKVFKQVSTDILEGELCCPRCGHCYPIQKGIAQVLPGQAREHTGGYDDPVMLSAYLWSHFGDLLSDARATDAYRLWASHFQPRKGDALDVGCAVGRLSLDLSATHSRVIGVDTSTSFIAKAREILGTKELDFELIIEGRLTEHRHLPLHYGWNFQNVEYIVADAMALPFSRSRFASVAAINVLEKVPDPYQHLVEVNRVLEKQSSSFLFSDPFSWDPAFSSPERWLGGTNGNGTYSQRGIETMRRFFAGEFGVFDPPLRIQAQGDVSWRIRKTENLWEYITSQFLLGYRQGESS